MKKLTILIPDDVPVDFGELWKHATDVRMETIPDPEPKLHKRAARSVHRGLAGRTAWSTIMNHYTPEGMFTQDIAKGWLVKEGYAGLSTSPTISNLKRDGYVEEISRQKYKFLKPFPVAKMNPV